MTTLVLWVAALALQDSKPHVEIAEKSTPSVVAVRSFATLGERSGTGVFLNEAGLILTSYWVVPEGAKDVRVWTHAPRRYQAEIVARSKSDEITLLRIKMTDPAVPMPRGDSSKVRVGDAAYTLGNAKNSFINDNSPAFNFGIVSGFYNLQEARASSYYKGWVFETTAAVNDNMEGAPLLNGEGKMIGMITLNYSPQRWLGNAIPFNALNDRIAQLVRRREPAEARKPVEGAGSVGFDVREEKGRLLVATVDPEGPAHAQGIREGDIIASFRGKEIRTLKEFEDLTRGLEAGDVIWMSIDFGGLTQELKIELDGPPEEPSE